MRRRRRDEALRVARAQGLFNVAGGLWPIVWLRSFEWVFGRKRDVYLQKTSGGLLLASGLTLLMAEAEPDALRAVRRIGIGVAATYLAIDLIYTAKDEIPKTYLLDGAAEIGWLWAWSRHKP